VSIGASLLLIAAGAILRYAVNADVQDIELDTVGLILMIVGIVGLVFSLLWMLVYADRGRGHTVVRERPRERDPYDR
jgi:hypothetical protein